MKGLQEKYQILAPGKIEGDEPWASFEAQRVIAPEVNREDMGKMNQMPPGYEIHGNSFASKVSGESDVSSQRMGLVTDKAMREGYGKAPMKMTDDVEFMDHADHFYGDAGGFIERNNYLDRE